MQAIIQRRGLRKTCSRIVAAPQLGQTELGPVVGVDLGRRLVAPVRGRREVDGLARRVQGVGAGAAQALGRRREPVLLLVHLVLGDDAF